MPASIAALKQRQRRGIAILVLQHAFARSARRRSVAGDTFEGEPVKRNPSTDVQEFRRIAIGGSRTGMRSGRRLGAVAHGGDVFLADHVERDVRPPCDGRTEFRQWVGGDDMGRAFARTRA